MNKPLQAFSDTVLITNLHPYIPTFYIFKADQRSDQQ